MIKRMVVILVLLAVVSAATWFGVRFAGSEGESLSPGVESLPDTAVPITPRKHASVGFSTADTETDAVHQAVKMAEERLGNKKAKFAFVTHTTGYNVEAVRTALDKVLSPEVNVFGLTSGRAVMTQDGFHQGTVGSLAILLVSDDSEVRFGVGAVDGTEENLEAQGRQAARNAIADAGMPMTQRPDIVLYGGAMHRGGEMRILDGMAEVVGPDTPILGGNAGQDSKAFPGAPFTRQSVYLKGLVVTAIYTNRTIGWSFEYGFRQTDTTGIITKANPAGNVIYEIDNQPALDVYNEWLNGKLLPVLETGSFRDTAGLTACNPISRRLHGRKGQSGLIVAEVIPTRENLKDRSLPIFAHMPGGSKIHLLAGRWQNLLNRSEQVASMALLRAGNRADNVEFALFHFCWAASQAIPPSELPKLPLLIRNQIPRTPFVGMFTKGETGLIPGVRNIHCNLAASMVVVEQEKQNGTPAPRKRNETNP